MKKLFFIISALVLLSIPAAAQNKFVEGTDFTVNFNPNGNDMPAVLHVNFKVVAPAPSEAELILRNQLKIYSSRAAKNIIGSVWYPATAENPELVKVKFKEGVSALVWYRPSGTIIYFPQYINSLKNAKLKKRDKALAEARQAAMETEIYQEAR